MSLLDRTRTHDHASGVERARARAGEATGIVMALLTGLWTAAISWLAVALPVLLVWAASAQTSATWGQATRLATQGWLLLHHVAVDVPGGRVSVVPLGLALVPLGLCWLAGRRMGGAAVETDRSPDPVDPADAARSLLTPLAGFAVGYALPVLVAGLVAHGAGIGPVAWQALPAGLLVALLGAAPAALRTAGVRVLPALADLVRLPATWRRAARPGALAAALVLLVAALLVLVALVVGHDRVLTLHRALDAGVVGGALLALAQAALLPDLVGWAVGFVAGPGFALGAGTSVTSGGSSLGLLPLVPVLGAVPPSGALPQVLVVLPLLPVLAGAVAGWLVARTPPDDVPDDGDEGARPTSAVLLEALAAAVVAVLLLTALVLLSGGAAGPGALQTVGASAWRVALVLAGEVGAGAVAAAWITHRHGRRQAAR